MEKFLKDNNIKQLYISPSLDISNTIFKNINIKNYFSTEENALFFGMYNKADYEMVEKHNGKKWILWAGNDADFTNMKRVKLMKNMKNIEKHIAYNDNIYNNLSEVFDNIGNIDNLNSEINNFILNINNTEILLIFYVDYLKSQMGVQNIYNMIKEQFSKSNTLIITNQLKEYSDMQNYYYIGDHSNRIYIKKKMQNYKKVYIFYPSQLSKKINYQEFNENNIKHVKIIHDLFPIEISHVYRNRLNIDSQEYNNKHIPLFLKQIDVFDIKIIYFNHYKYTIYDNNYLYLNFNKLKFYDNCKLIDNSIKNLENLNLLYPAQYQYRKNHKILNDTLIKYNLKCNIYCTGNRKIPKYDLYELEKLELNKASNLHFLGFLNENEYKKIIEETDGYIIPSIAEGGAYVIEELIKTTKPIAVNNYNTIASFILDLEPLDLSKNLKKKIIISKSYKISEKDQLYNLLNLKKSIILKKIDLLNKLCSLYLPNLYIFDSESSLETKKAIDWINNYKSSNYINNLINNIKPTKTKFEFISNNYSKSIQSTKNYLDHHNLMKLKNIHNLYLNEDIFIINGLKTNNNLLDKYKNEYILCTANFYLLNKLILPNLTFCYLSNNDKFDNINEFKSTMLFSDDKLSDELSKLSNKYCNNQPLNGLDTL